MGLFHFVELIQHIVDIIEDGLIFRHSFFFGLIFLRKRLSADIFIFAHEIPDVLVLVLDN